MESNGELQTERGKFLDEVVQHRSWGGHLITTELELRDGGCTTRTAIDLNKVMVNIVSVSLTGRVAQRLGRLS